MSIDAPDLVGVSLAQLGELTSVDMHSVTSEALQFVSFEYLPRLASASVSSPIVDRLYLYGIDDCADLNWFQDLSNLRMLQLVRLPTFSDISLPGENHAIASVYLIHLDQLASISALANTTALQTLSIEDCPALSDLGDIPASIQELTLSDCAITSLEVLPELPNCDSLSVQSCESLTSIQGLASLTALQWFSIAACTNLVDLNSHGSLEVLERALFSNLPLSQSLEGFGPTPALRELRVSNCESIEQLGLSGLPEEMTSIELGDCPALPSVAGFEGVRVVEHNLSLHSCDLLEDLSPLYGLNSIGSLNIDHNAYLSESAISEFLSEVPDIGFTSIYANGSALD